MPAHGQLYAPQEARFERVTRLACQALSVPKAAIFLAEQDEWFVKSVAGSDALPLPEHRALHGLVMESEGPAIISDLSGDARTCDCDFVRSAPNLRFYAAYPLLGEHHWPIGSLAVLDVVPRQLSPGERQSLLDLAEWAQRELVVDPVSGTLGMSLAAQLSVARRESLIDPLTRLWNARGAETLIPKAIQQSAAAGIRFGLAAFNVDGFRRINEIHGVQAADELLREIANRLIASVRGDDLVFRLDADEFLVLMGDVESSTVRQIVERVRWTLTEQGPAIANGEWPISIRAGLAVHSPNDDGSVERLLERARAGSAVAHARACHRLPRIGAVDPALSAES